MENDKISTEEQFQQLIEAVEKQPKGGVSVWTVLIEENKDRLIDLNYSVELYYEERLDQHRYLVNKK
ncbi:hypothetical protein [Elizabethkingia miricola]|uniref:hypothetical protein n=1 Tax=Elizabethkingia miricola TaxID=172045 RepID=UPI003891EE89